MLIKMAYNDSVQSSACLHAPNPQSLYNGAAAAYVPCYMEIMVNSAQVIKLGLWLSLAIVLEFKTTHISGKVKPYIKIVLFPKMITLINSICLNFKTKF